MKITKNVWGRTVELELIKIKSYPNYTVYSVRDKNGVELYKESFTDDQLKRIITNGNCYLNDKEYGRCS